MVKTVKRGYVNLFLRQDAHPVQQVLELLLSQAGPRIWAPPIPKQLYKELEDGIREVARGADK